MRAYICVSGSVVCGCMCVVYLLSVFRYLLRLVCGFSCLTLLFFTILSFIELDKTFLYNMYIRESSS